MKKSLIMLFFVSAGIVIGCFVSHVTKDVSWLSWLSYGKPFGFTKPLELSLGVLNLSFSASFDLSISVILFTILSVLLCLAILRRR